MHVLSQIWGAGRAYWHTATGPQRLLFVTGSILFAVMAVAAAALVATGGSIDGPVSLRKVITFAESLGLLCWSLGWALPLFRLSRAAWPVAGYVALFALAEVGMFALQVWRGVPSHYNFTTPFDMAIYLGTGAGALIFTLIAGVLLALSGRLRDQPASIAFAVRAGLVITLFGSAAGVLMVVNHGGVWQGLAALVASNASDPLGRYLGPAAGARGGDLVALHALGVHGLQVVPLAAWLLSYSTLGERARLAATAALTAAYLLLTAALTVHALRGLPLTAMDAPTLLAAGTALAALLGGYAACAWLALRGTAGRQTDQAVLAP